MALIPFYKTTIKSNLTPNELCQKLALFVEQKDLEETYLRDFLSLGVADMMIYGDYKKLFLGKYNEEMIEIRTSTAHGSMGGFNLNYLFGKIKPTNNGGSSIEIKVHGPKIFNYILILIATLILIYQLTTLIKGFDSNVPYVINWIPFIWIGFGYILLLIQFNMGLHVYKERLFPHIKSNSIQDILNRRKYNKERRAARRR